MRRKFLPKPEGACTRWQAEIGYLPDRAAQRLKTGRTNVISVILEPHEEILGFGISLMQGLARALKDTPYHLIVTPNFIDDGNIEAISYIVRNGMADGMIFSRTEPFDPRVRLLIENGFPFVTHGRTEFSTPHPYVDYDNFSFAYEATRRLITRGRRKPMIILPPKRMTFSQHLLHGFMTAVREAGVAYEIPDEIDLDCPVEQIRAYYEPARGRTGCARRLCLRRRSLGSCHDHRHERSRPDARPRI